MTTGKTIALTRQTFVGKVMSLLFNTLSGLVIAFLPRSKRLLISAPQFKGIDSSVLSLLYGPTLTSIYDYWKNHSFDYMEL